MPRISTTARTFPAGVVGDDAWFLDRGGVAAPSVTGTALGITEFEGAHEAGS